MFGASGWRRHLVIAVSIVLTFQAVSVSPSAAQTQGPADRQPQPAETIVSPPAHELTRLAAPHDTFQEGDVFVATGSQIQWRLPDWTLNATLSVGGTVGDMAFDSFGNLYVTDVSNGRVQKFGPGGTLIGTFASGMNQPSGIDIDSAGNVIVGERVTSVVARVFKFDPAGTKLGEWQQPGGRTVFYGDLASDDCTFRHTPNTANWVGTAVHTTNVCTGAFGSISTQTPVNGSHFQLNGLPNDEMLITFASPFGHSGGGTGVVRYAATGGSPLQLYEVGDPQANDPWLLRPVAGDPVNGWLWTGTASGCASFGCETGGRVWRVDLASGAELSTHTTGTSSIVAMEVFQHQEIQVPFAGPPAEQTAGGPSSSRVHGNHPSRFEADPVNTLTGNYVSQATDLSYPGRGLAFGWQRTYNSLFAAIDGPLGPGWTHAYDAHLVPLTEGAVAFHAEDGATFVFTPDGSGGFVAPPGARSRLEAAPGGGYQLIRPDQLRYDFDSGGVLQAIADRNGNHLTFGYASGLLTSITDTVGRSITVTYTAGEEVETISGPGGLSVSYAYDPNGRLASATDVRGETWSYTYDAAGRLATITDPNAHVVVTNEYGPDGRVTAQTDARGKRGTFAWDAETETSTYTDANGGAWTDEHSNGVLVRVTDPLGNATVYLHDPQFRVTSVIDPRGNLTSMAYDSAGNLTRLTPPDGSSAEDFAYNARNDVVTAKNGRGFTTSFEYDAAGNLTRTTAPLTTLTEFGRDPAGTGLLTSLTDPRGKVTTYGYDAEANLTSTTTPLGHHTTMAYDAAGRMQSLVEPRGNASGANPADYTTTFTYDPAGNLLSVTDPLGNVTTQTYDPVGNRLTATDAKQRTTTYTYDDANHLTSVTDARNGVTAYAYDDVGNLVTRTDANQHVTTYAYDLANRLTSTTDPLSNSWALTYDAAGNVATRTDANAQVTTHTYDARNRLTRITYANTSTPTVTYAYDANGNVTALTGGGGSETFTYDALDRLTAVTRGTDSFNYGYDAAGDLTSRTYPGQTAQTLVYDDDGRLTSANGATYAYDPAANLVTAATPDGLTARYRWDRAGRLLEVAHTTSSATLSRFSYALDPVGNRTAMTTRQGTATYRYDELDRLTEACWSQSACPGGAPAAPLPCLECIGGLVSRPSAGTNPPPGETYRTYTYDPVGNRLTEATNAGTTTYAYDAADRMTSVTPPGQAALTYTYDANGNQLTGSGATYTYDLADRLKTATVGGTTETYTYAGDGTRLSASTGSQANKTTNYLWDRAFGLPQLAIERNGNDALLRSYRYGLDLLSQAAGNKTYWYHHDGLGSVVDITNASGTSVSWSEYYPYGLLRQQGKAGGGNGAPAVQTFAFTGEQLDSLTGLYHLRARQYDPGTGRFLSTDPVAPLLTDPYVGTYVYVRNMPTLAVDPAGTCLQFAGAGLAAALPSGGTSAIAGGAATLFCLAFVATVAVTAPSVGEGVLDLAKPRYPESEPIYDPRQDPDAGRVRIEIERLGAGGAGEPPWPAGGMPGSGWCARHRAACIGLIVIGGGGLLWSIFLGLPPGVGASTDPTSLRGASSK